MWVDIGNEPFLLEVLQGGSGLVESEGAFLFQGSDDLGAELGAFRFLKFFDPSLIGRRVTEELFVEPDCDAKGFVVFRRSFLGR